MYLIGIDLGTTGCKSVVFNEEGRILGEAYIEYALHVLSEGRAEQDAGQWWELAGQAVCSAVRSAGIPRDQIRSVGISSQGIAFVPVDAALNPLAPAISWLDTRAGKETEEIGEKLDPDRLFRITGKRLNASYTLPKLLWLKKHIPEVYSRTYKFLMPQDFLLAQLTGRCITDHTMAAGTMLYDVEAQEWSREILDLFGLDSDRLPEIRRAGECAGMIRKQVAAQWGWPESVAVGVGAQDQKAAALGASIEPGVAALSLGTAGAMEFLIRRPVFDAAKRLPCFPYIDPGQWLLEAVVSTAGASVKWVCNTLFPGMAYSELDRLCEMVAPGAGDVFFYPHLAGATSPHWNSKLKGMLYGITLGTSREEIVRSVLEGTAYQLKSNIMTAEELGCRVAAVRIFGGGAKSDIWCRMIADITGKKIIAFSSPEIANLGAGILAARAAGMEAGGFGREIRNDYTEYFPGHGKAEIYKEAYARYCKIEKRLMSFD